MVTKILTIEEITAYKIASELSDDIWKLVSKWDWLAKTTLGTQFIRAIDSIPANIAEGYGRYHKKDKIKFYYNARGSVFESAHWCKKASTRKLVSNEEGERILEVLRQLPREINSLISYTEKKLAI